MLKAYKETGKFPDPADFHDKNKEIESKKAELLQAIDEKKKQKMEEKKERVQQSI